MVLEEKIMRELLPDLAQKRVLDLACGTGRWGQIALEQGAAQVISLDDSHAMLTAQTRPPLAILGNMNALPLPAHSIDVILCGLAIGHTPHLGAVLGAMGRVLRPGGSALISDVHPLRAWQGAQRTFASGGQTLAVEHHIHSYAAYHAAAAQAQLAITAIREAALSPTDPPVLLVIRLGRTG
jgi:malonyl-CoA O-methyltransferase